MNIAFFNRPCDLTYYGPFVSDVRLPTQAREWDNDNFPQYIEIAFCESKGDLTGRPYKQLLKRNYVNVEYCPVIRLLACGFVEDKVVSRTLDGSFLNIPSNSC